MSETSSYIITLEGDILQVGFNKEISTTGDRIVRDADAQLKTLINSGQLNGGALLKIHGKMSVLVSYTLAHALIHLYAAIAVFDPRLSAYVVVKSDHPDYPIASRIDATTGKVTCQPEIEPSNPSSFLLHWKGDILKAELNGRVTAEGDRIVYDTHQQLQTLIESGQLPGSSEPLLINGRASVLASFAIASRAAHLYSTIAVYDPKVGDPDIEQYTVVISHSPHPIGDLLTLALPPTPSIKVVLCGSPNTGKTCLHHGLKTALHQLPELPDAYVISGCPDGEGSWFSETARRDPKLARQLKNEYKSKFTPEFAAAKASEIRAIANPLLVFDVGGKISPDNKTIMSEATHAVILAKNDAEVAQWQEFCEKLKLPIIAILHSDYNGKSDRLECESPILKGSIHHLDRKEDASSRLMVQNLVRVLVNLVLSTARATAK